MCPVAQGYPNVPLSITLRILSPYHLSVTSPSLRPLFCSLNKPQVLCLHVLSLAKYLFPLSEHVFAIVCF